MNSSPLVIKFPEDVLKPNVKPETWASIRDKQVIPALEKNGYFMADCGDLKGTRNPFFKASKEIFDCLAKTNSVKPEYESIDILEATGDSGSEKVIKEVPEGNEGMRKTILGYARTAAELEKTVRKMVLEHYKLPKESTGYIFRMMKNREKVTLGCSDNKNRIEFLAVLDLNEVNGLKMKYDGRWCEIGVKPSTFLIMAGKPLKDWSEGKIHPLEHQVKMDGNEERYSVGLFSYYENKGKNDKGRTDKVKTEASKEQVGN